MPTDVRLKSLDTPVSSDTAEYSLPTTATWLELTPLTPQQEPEPSAPPPQPPRWIDCIIALFLLGPALLFMLPGALCVCLTSRGGPIYTQTRVGWNGRQFTIYKLRSMTKNSEQETGAIWSQPGDSRITWVGSILRKTHVDELPQLFNVLKGDMSMIGPRPERPELTPSLAMAYPHYDERHAIRPGVTGLAQILLPADTSIESVGHKLKCDLYYIQHRTLGLDLRIMVCTCLKMLRVPLRPVRRLLSIPKVLND